LKRPLEKIASVSRPLLVAGLEIRNETTSFNACWYHRCGNISDIYVRNAKLFRDIEIIACADINPSAAERLARKYSLRETSARALLAADDIEIILNLTLPVAHAEVSQAAIVAGKHVYSEKPLATSLQDAAALIEEAEAKELRVGCTPDTILGAGLQTAKALIDEGRVGQIIRRLCLVDFAANRLLRPGLARRFFRDCWLAKEIS
jgi:predicted dehydrogenase